MFHTNARRIVHWFWSSLQYLSMWQRLKHSKIQMFLKVACSDRHDYYFELSFSEHGVSQTGYGCMTAGTSNWIINLPLLTCHNVNTLNIRQSGKMHPPAELLCLCHTQSPYFLYNPNKRKHGCVGRYKIYIHKHKSNNVCRVLTISHGMKWLYQPINRRQKPPCSNC